MKTKPMTTQPIVEADDELRNKLRSLSRTTHTDPRYPIDAYEDDLVELINSEVRQAFDRLIKALPDTTFHGSSIKAKDNIRDGGYHDGVRDSRLIIEAERQRYE